MVAGLNRMAYAENVDGLLTMFMKLLSWLPKRSMGKRRSVTVQE